MPHSYRSRYLAEFHAQLRAEYRYANSKYRTLIEDKWQLIRELASGHDVLGNLSFCEVHVATPCNLSCNYCRGSLRDIPAQQPLLDRTHVLKIIDEIHDLNPKCFVRLSGTIGEPTVHPHIADICARLNRHGLDWGMTTNGLRLDAPGLTDELLRADYVHVSIDAGSDSTYQSLKRGKPGDYAKVLENLRQLVAARESASTPQIVVSFLLQSENYHELPAVSADLQNVGADVLEIKCQHYDPRHGMQDNEIKQAYELISQLRDEIDGNEQAAIKLVAVQSEEEAIRKTQDSAAPEFARCYANILGLNATIDPTGDLQPCCQYFGDTLPSQGNTQMGLGQIWNRKDRQVALAGDPRKNCSSCSPSDDFINRFVAFLVEAQRADPSFLDWVESNLQVKET